MRQAEYCIAYAGWIMQGNLEQTEFMLDRWLYWETQRSLVHVLLKVESFILFRLVP